MFGYLNLNDPTKIDNNEAQEATNCRVDRGYLEYKDWQINEDLGRELKDLSGRRLFVDATFPAAGVIRRYISAANPTDPIGLPVPATITGWNAGGTPGIHTPYAQAVVSASQIYPVGTYNYAVTIYDADTGEESVPTELAPLAIGALEKASFGAFPAVTDTAFWASKPNLEYRVYRRPLGGSEYLLVPFTTIDATNGYAGPINDETADADLGVALDSWNNYPLTSSVDLAKSTYCMAVHNNKLFTVTNANRLSYSRTANLGSFPESFYYDFPEAIMSLFSVNEALVIGTLGGVYILYGQDENDFLLKRVDSGTPGVAAPFLCAPVSGSMGFVGSLTESGDDRGVFLMSGPSVSRVSHKLDNNFPLGPGGATMTGAGAENNRFLVFFGVGADGNLVKVILDTATGGFLTGNSDSTFSYRSKEFGRPGSWDNMKRAFVRGVGDFTIELYGDFEKTDEIEFSIAGTVPVTEDFTVPPSRHNYFSFRIIGQSSAKVYEFGRLE